MSAFNFDKWLEKHNIQNAKEILIKHDMTTLKNLSMQNRNFCLLVTDPGLCGKIQLIQSVIMAIQTLPYYANHSETNENSNAKEQKEKPTPLNDTKDNYKSDEKEEKQNKKPFNNTFITLSSKEDATMQQIQEYVNDMQDLKNDLIESHHKCNISKISNKKTAEKKYKICFKELERIKREIELYINKLTTKITDQDNSLKSKIEKYQQAIHDEKTKRENEVSGINDILNNYSMTLNRSIQHYKRKIVQCRNIIKNHGKSDEIKDDKYYASTTNTEREKNVLEIGREEKQHYDTTRNEIKIYRKQIDEFIEEDLVFMLYKTNSAPINKEIYENIAKNIDSFMSFNGKSTKYLSRIEMLQIKLRNDTKEVIDLVQARVTKLQQASHKQSEKVSSLFKEIDRLNAILQDIEGDEQIRQFKLYDSGLCNVSEDGKKMYSTHSTYHSLDLSMVVGGYDSIHGYNSGIHKWSVKRETGIRGVRSIGVISPRDSIKQVSLVLKHGTKWNNTFFSYFDGQSEHQGWKSGQTISVVLNCNEGKVVYYKTINENTEPIKQEDVEKHRSYFFALVVDPNVYGGIWSTHYQCVKTPHACTAFFNFV